MNRKLKIAVLYRKSNPFLSGHYYNNNVHRFVMQDLPRNDRVEVSFFGYDNFLDCRFLKNFHVMLIVTYPHGQLEGSNLLYLGDVKIPKLTISPDCHLMSNTWTTKCRQCGIKTAIWEHASEWYDKNGPDDMEYHQIIFGLLDQEVYQLKNDNFNKRISDKILLTGDCGGDRPKTIKWRAYYMLRRACRELPFVEYLGRGERTTNDNYPKLLKSYRASIAASTKYTVSKYVEIPAARTLSFMEVSDINNYEKLGFVDRETAVFINEKNYREVFQEYFDTIDDPKWERIAEAGRVHVLENFRADVQVNKLVDIMFRKMAENDS